MSNTRATSPGPSPAGRRPQPGAHEHEVPSITNAPEPLGADQSRRTRVYVIQMTVRLVCFLTAVFFAEGWVRWTLFGLAIVLPYSAVLFANAGRDRVQYDTSPVTDVPPAELPAAPTAPADGTGAHRVVEHEDDDDDDDDDDAHPDDARPDGRPTTQEDH